MAVFKQLTATSALVAAMICGSAAVAWADPPPNPAAQMTATQPAGPVIWNMNQEMSALTTARPLDPEFIAKGIPIGDGGPWRLYTNLVSAVSYDDNVYRVAHGVGFGPESDFFFTESPTVVLDYSTSLLRLDAYADATFNEYSKLSQVNNTEYDFGLRGTYTISRAAQLTGNISYSQDAQPLSSPNNIGFQARPTLYNDLNASTQFKYQPNRLGFTVGANVDVYSYLDQPVIGGGPQLDISYRNDTVFRGFVEGDYDFSPGYEGFVRASYDNDSYHQYFDITGTHRSSTGEQYDAGVKMLLTNLVQGQLYIGYLSDQYDHHQVHPLNDVAGLDFGASVTWFPTELLTLNLAAQRAISNTTIATAAAGDDKYVILSADYELTRQFHVTASGGYDGTNYAQLVGNQHLETATFSVGTKWYISHYVEATAAYVYTTRSSNVSTFAYNDNLVTVGLNLQI